MKIAYFGYNGLSSCLSVFEKHGHDIAVIFTGNDNLHADQVINFARQNSIPLVFDKPEKKQLYEYVREDIDCFISAEYPWFIPIPETLKYAINIHPTMLPFGRGPTPISYFLLNNTGHSGVTLHKMTNQFDKGDILIQQPIELDSIESYDSFSSKLFIKAPILLDTLLSKLDVYYNYAQPQQGGSYWPPLTKEEQTVNWYCCVDEILKQSRAFGRLGVYSEINCQPVLITSVEGTHFDHMVKPGTVTLNDQSQVVVAVFDGLISIAKNALFFL